MGKISHDVKVLEGRCQSATSLPKTWNCENNCSEHLGQVFQGNGIRKPCKSWTSTQVVKRDERKLVITSKRNPFLTPKKLAESMPNAANIQHRP